MSFTSAVVALTALNVIGSVAQGQSSRQQARFESKITEQQAQRERENAAASEDDFRRRQSRVQAQRRAELGRSGVQQSTGSPLLATGDFEEEVELAARRIRSGGDIRATRLEQQADLIKSRGRSQRRGSFAQAGSSLLSGSLFFL